MNKKLLAVAISGALAAPFAAQAVDFKISGHVNRVIMFADDGIGSDVQHLDSSTSNSRWRIQGSADIGNGMKAGTYLEWFAASDHHSSGRDVKDTADGSSEGNIKARHTAIWFSGNWGRVWMGNTWTAAFGTAGNDVSGSDISGNNPAYADIGGGVEFKISGGAGASSGTAVGDAFNKFDGNGRKDLIRYDSPSFSGFQIKADAHNNSGYSAGLYYDGSIGGGKLEAGFGYTNFPGNTSTFDDQWGGSASFRFAQGTSISVGYQEKEARAVGRADAQNLWLKVGHAWGNNAVGVHYGQVDDLDAHGDEGTAWGIGFVHKIPKPRVEIYASYSNFDLDRPGVALEDVDVFGIGSRIQFR